MKRLREEIVEDRLANLVEGQAKIACAEPEGEPGQIAVAQVVTLGVCFPTLALLGARQRLEFSVELLNLPA